MASIATVISFLLGTGLAWLLARRRFRGREIVSAVVTIPLVLPPTVLGYYLLTAIGRQSVFGRFLEDTLGVTLVFTWQAAVLASCIVSLPLMVRTAQASMESIDPELEKAARTLGRSELAIFVTITVPLAWRGILAGAALAFARAIGEFGATLMVAGNIPGRTQTMAVAIYDAVQAGKLSLANTLVVILTAVTVAALAILGWAGRGSGR
ncbi:MAG: molybdate ABC transporter permease subunit [Dehalococcoidia bacterium]|nr:molybdate ABC transporter permease subunit [Dehalococcoidia bacterium]